MENMNDSLVKSIWGIKDIGWVHLQASGTAGGILLMWN